MQDQGRYSVCGEIASGSTATVFLAEDKVLRRKVALKKLHPHLLGHSETVKRFRKEALAIASLSHENIIQVYDYGDQDHNLFLAMEYVDGVSLEKMIGPSPPRILPNLAGLSVLHQLMRGLAAAHGAGIVHRDVKPSNVLVDRKGCVRIADFGIAFLGEENSITKTGSYLGTPVYSSPEQAQGIPASDKTDIFSAGILFYRCLTGHLPFNGENSHAILRSILETSPRKPAAVNRRLFPGLSELAMAMLAKEPERRPDAAACVAELEAVAARMGFPLEASRAARLVASPDGYPEEERREIAAAFRERAAREEAQGSARKAQKLSALADLHAEAPKVMETSEFRAMGVTSESRFRRSALALSALAAGALMMGGAAWWISRPSPQEVPAPPAAAIPAAPEAAAVPAPIAPAPVSEAAPSPEILPDRPTLAASGLPDSRLPSGAPAPSPAGALPVSAPAAAEAVLEAPPEPGPGYLVVKSNPPFADVSVDGRFVGHTPFKGPVRLETGDHEVVLEREGCKPLKAAFRIDPGETTTLRLSLEKADQVEEASR